MLTLLHQFEEAGSTLVGDKICKREKVQPCCEFRAGDNANLVGPLINSVNEPPLDSSL